MKQFLIILVFFTVQFSIAQDAKSQTQLTKKGLSDIEYIEAKELYLKMCSSELYLEQRKVTLKIVNKFNKVQNLDFLLKDEDFSKWISENLALTQFKNIEEATELRNLCFELQKKLEEENSKVFEFISRATIKQLAEILKPERLTEDERHQ